VHEIGQAQDFLVGSCGFAAGQGAELVEVRGRLAFRLQVSVDEYLVREFIFGVVVDVLVHVAIERNQVQRSCRQRHPSNAHALEK
jgi:hypothetical protein